MSFEDEWGGLKQAAAERRTGMRLNRLPPEAGGGGTADLKSAPARKRAFADTIETRLEKPTREAGDTVDEAMGAAARAFAGWDTAAGLQKAHEKWEDQVNRLVGRLVTNKTQLRNAATQLLGTDLDVGHGLRRPQSNISGL
ncbi:hypothetical protein [Streptomyces sp. DH12]|uniref:hypothetical protein n=1 Tax=Streptomyces sp. DH12 TaxID=2857010 RepID=UPI001E536234|nr:hypothetical protein [Streptomyces sp. DH12]